MNAKTMEPRETKPDTATRAVASASAPYMHTTIANINTSNNEHNAAASYSMSTLGLIPSVSWHNTGHQSGRVTSKERGRDTNAGFDTARASDDNAPLVSQQQMQPQPQPQPWSQPQPQPQPQPQQQSQQRYVPQFSAATSLILSRIKGDDKDFNSALSAASATISRPDKDAFEEAKMRLMRQMNATLPGLPTPEPSNLSQSQSQSQSQPQTSPKEEVGSEDAIQKGTKKRKRDVNEDGDSGVSVTAEEPVDFNQNTIPFPIQQIRPSGMSAVASSVSGMCVKCGSSSSNPSNTLVACARCSMVCHQACFALSLTAEQDRSGGAPHYLSLCPQCDAAAPGQPLNNAHVQPELLRRKQKIEKIRQMRLAALPEGVAPAKPELVGFGPGAASDRARADYFSNMTKTDALNLLSFCDQLRPQLLIDVMVSVSKRHPDLLMFSSPDWNASESRLAATPSSSKAAAAAAAHASSRKANIPAGRPPHGRSLLNSKAKQKIKSGSIAKQQALKRPAKRPQLPGYTVEDDAAATAAAAADDGDVENVDEDAPPPTWPKPGDGFYIKLAPEINDRLFLADENDEEAFSHFMVDKVGRQIIEPV